MTYAEAHRLAMSNAASWRNRAERALHAGMIGSHARFTALAEQSEARASFYSRFTTGRG